MERKKKRIAILGSTGSIGTQALQVIAEHPDLFEAEVLTANNRVDLLVAQARQFQPNAVVIANESKYPELREALADQPIKVYSGSDALCQVVESQEVDVVLTALVGFAGLLPTMVYRSDKISDALNILHMTSDFRIYPKIRKTGKVDDMTFAQRPLIESSPHSSACVDYRRFVREYTQEGRC